MRSSSASRGSGGVSTNGGDQCDLRSGGEEEGSGGNAAVLLVSGTVSVADGAAAAVHAAVEIRRGGGQDQGVL